MKWLRNRVFFDAHELEAYIKSAVNGDRNTFELISTLVGTMGKLLERFER